MVAPCRIQKYASGATKDGSGDQEQSSGVASKGKPKTWWRPDPSTGVWVPGGDKEEGNAKTGNEEVTVRRRTIASASLEERAWWSSMEEIPDRHYN